MSQAKIFASFLVQELPCHMARASIGHGVPANTLVEEMSKIADIWKEALEECEKRQKELREKGIFFHPEGGSVFMDYQKLRDSVLGTDSMGSIIRVTQRFRLNMATDEILSTAEQVVNEWQSTPHKERKG